MIYFRADMNAEIATGHVIRCLSIADRLREKGEEAVFITADHEADQLLRTRGFRQIVLDTDWRDMEAEIPTLQALLKKEAQAGDKPLIFVDGYFVTAPYLQALRGFTRLWYIDDLNRFLYPVDGLICYAAYYRKFSYEVRYPDTRLVLGTKYMPMRDGFAEGESPKIREKMEHILIVSGGSDQQGILRRLIAQERIRRCKNVTVICGMLYGDYDGLMRDAADRENIRILRSTDKLRDYMLSSDLVISAGGTTLYELCACGIPTISYSLADNQLDNVRWFSEAEIIDYAGDVRSDDVPENCARLMERYEDTDFRRERSRRMLTVTDGRGAGRIADILIAERKSMSFESLLCGK